MTKNNNIKNWFTVYVKPKCEIKTALQLEMLGIKAIIPKKFVRISDKTFNMIIQDGKIFAYISEIEKSRILQIPYIIRIGKICKNEKFLLLLNE